MKLMGSGCTAFLPLSGVPANGGAPAAARGRNVPHSPPGDRACHLAQSARSTMPHVGRPELLLQNGARYPSAATHAEVVQSRRRRRHVRAGHGQSRYNPRSRGKRLVNVGGANDSVIRVDTHQAGWKYVGGLLVRRLRLGDVQPESSP